MTKQNARIASMDQFRGYTVAGMFAVNFLAGMMAIHPVMAHHDTYFSYADSIMPSFLFAVGFSFRLTMLRRLATSGRTTVYLSYARRSLALVLVSLMMYGFGISFPDWHEITAGSVREFLARLLKADLWEVLAIIGVTQIFIMPLAAASGKLRVASIAGFLVVHGLLSHWFNFDFVYGRENWLDSYWGAAGKRAWDGGFFGILPWSAVMLGGTLAHDVVVASSPKIAARRLLALGTLLMVVGYSLSCLTRLYDVPPGTTPTDEAAASPVWPPLDQLAKRPFSTLFAEPPFVPPPPPSERWLNYWMMGKRVVSASFVLFATGFSFAAYALFVVACDVGGCAVGVFRTFGQNPLAAYVIHYMVETAVRPLVPDNSPLWYCLCGFLAFFAITYVFVRHLEKHQIYLRL